MHDATEPGMNELSAHLDRAWDLFDRGDIRGAERSAREALVHEPECPEAFTLLGVIDIADGNPERGMEQFEHAIALDPDYVEPYLHAAETALYQLDRGQDALRLAEEALEHAQEPEEHIDALLLKIEAFLAREDAAADAAAHAALAQLPQDLPEDVPLLLRAAHVCFELHEVNAAEPYYQAATRLDPECSDAWYGLGLCAEARDDEAAKCRFWLKSRALDVTAETPPWAVSEEHFEELAEQTLAELPAEIRDRLTNVPIIASDYPGDELVRDGFDPRMLGFFSGVPYPERQLVGTPSPHLDCIFLFQRNIERIVQSKEELGQEIRITLIHEAGHFFALDEARLEELGLG
jgi:predicted Zn-dependent protease with MMP-like domain/cytochrome c-type biogenesis protein CcmH/NrfG